MDTNKPNQNQKEKDEQSFSAENENSQKNEIKIEETTPTEKKSSWQIVLTIIAIIAIILVFALPSDSNKSTTEEVSVEDETEETTDTENISTETKEETKTNIMKPVKGDDGLTYSFKGIEWVLSPVDAKTAVKFKFSEFSRRKGSVVAFGNPYNLGTFAGDCSETTSLSYDKNTDTPLAFISCRVDTKNGTDIGLFQKDKKVYASQRVLEEGVFGEFSEFFSRDITTIVK